MKKFLFFCGLGTLCAILACGCEGILTGVDARRDARRAAFDPLRPDPQYRLLPDRPIHLSQKTGKRPVPPTPVRDTVVEPPYVWKANRLADLGLHPGASRFHAQTVEVYFKADKDYQGKLRAVARNGNAEEVARTTADIQCKAGEGKFVTFEFPGKILPGELRVIAIDLAQ